MSSDYLTASEAGSHQRGYSEVSGGSADSSASQSRPSSPSGIPQRKNTGRGRVRFNATSEANDLANQRSSVPLRDRSQSPEEAISPTKPSKASAVHPRNGSAIGIVRHSPQKERNNPIDHNGSTPVVKPRPSVLRNSSYNADPDDVDEVNEKAFSALAAQERAQRIASLVGSNSAPTSRRGSFDDDDDDDDHDLPVRHNAYPVRIDDIPLMNMKPINTYDGQAIEEDDPVPETSAHISSSSEAHKLVRAHTTKMRGELLKEQLPVLPSGNVTPNDEQFLSENYVPRPEEYRGGVLSSLLKLYNPAQGRQTPSRRNSMDTDTGTGTNTPMGSSGMNTPSKKSAKWYKAKNQSQDTLAGLIEASAILGAQGGGAIPDSKRGKPKRPGMGARKTSGKIMEKFKPRLEDEIRVTIHIAEILCRQKYLVQLCKALMIYGAPTHRLEEYIKMSARVLEISLQSLYIPGCMILSFDDPATHTTDVKLVKAAHAVDLGKLKETHEIYKEVVHDVIGVEEATQRLEEIMRSKRKHNAWLLVFVYGIASATVGPFAFQSRWIDLPIAFLLGSLLGFLQLIVAPTSDLYSNVFEITAAVVTSFLSRAFGSIRGGNLFCFSALAQSSIALILPGYMVLCGSLELQSKSMVAGAVRMVYAIIYSLFLGFGITIGSAFYGIIDPNASSATTCSNQMNDYVKWAFVPLFTLSLCVINQAKWKQTPAMLFISFAGYIVNFYSAKKFPSSAQISNTFGALAVGVLGNLYSRVRHGVAAAAILPAIFVQVPSGLAAAGSLLAGISSADQITNTTSYRNGTAKFNGTTNGNVLGQISITQSGGDNLNNIVYNVGYSMIQVAIGITVGLFLSALIVYPFGKKRSGLFSF
ncbi:hypothetical protein HYFRA_00003313 [Hymenoscyphus fraxineus]|uniref:DUF1212-domain-containing protein n=1 Tax=Hymenoscyphus fraxineus TaxID=746836 RepID=A0A9N9KU49_9HELO|nr:hypothetical protein HYFRA_00003313 [Hymenoscyphus fraxineus]